MPLTPCDTCGCIHGNVGNDKFKQDVESVLCQTLTALGYEFPEGGCDPCSCIPGNIANDKFKQDVEVLLCALLDAVSGGGSAWALLGNAGTDSSLNFLGTTDLEAFAVRVDNIQIGIFLTNQSAWIAGVDNTIDDDSYACFIGGGDTNLISNSLDSAILGGMQNTISAQSKNVIIGSQGGIIGGSVSNCALISSGQDEIDGSGGQIVTIAGGGNIIHGGGPSVILAGSSNTFTSNSYEAVLLGADQCTMDGGYSTILGGTKLSVRDNFVGYQSPTTGGLGVKDLSAFTDLAYFGDVDLWVANSDGTARKLKFIEPNSDLDFSSANFSSFEAQSQAADLKYKLPSTAPTASQVLSCSAAAAPDFTLSWSSPTITAISDTSSIDLSLTGTTISGVSKISADAGNQVSIHADGLFVTAPTVTAISDTSSIDLSLTGTTISGVSKISVDAGNQVSIHADGLYVPTPSAGDASTGAITTKTSNFPATTANYTILCDATSGAITITLPAVAGASTHILNIMKIDSSLNAVILDGNASETINGDLTKTITQQYTNLTVQCDGSAWYII